MTFRQLLTHYRQRAGLNMTQLASRLPSSAPGQHLSQGYIANLESGRSKPPTIIRVNQIADALSLTKTERENLIRIAAEERTHSVERKILISESRAEYGKAIDRLSPDVLEALSDPIAVKALLITHRNKPDIKDAIISFLECLPGLEPEKRQAIIALCK